MNDFLLEKPILEELPEKFRRKVLEQLPTTTPLRLGLTCRYIYIYGAKVMYNVCILMPVSLLTLYQKRATGSGAAGHVGVCAMSAAMTNCGRGCFLKDMQRSWWNTLYLRNQTAERWELSLVIIKLGLYFSLLAV